jgi:hypothetical protein
MGDSMCIYVTFAWRLFFRVADAPLFPFLKEVHEFAMVRHVNWTVDEFIERDLPPVQGNTSPDIHYVNNLVRHSRVTVW